MSHPQVMIRRWRTWQLVHLITRRQHGLITRVQALGCGLTPKQIKGLLSSGQLDVAASRCVRGRRRAADLGAGGPRRRPRGRLGRASRRTAPSGGCARLKHVTADEIEILSPLGRHKRLDGVVGHRSGALFDADRTVYRSIPVTTVARTLVDVSGRLTARRLGEAVDDALATTDRRPRGSSAHGGPPGLSTRTVDAAGPSGPGVAHPRLRPARQRLRDPSATGADRGGSAGARVSSTRSPSEASSSTSTSPIRRPGSASSSTGSSGIAPDRAFDDDRWRDAPLSRSVDDRPTDHDDDGCRHRRRRPRRPAPTVCSLEVPERAPSEQTVRSGGGEGGELAGVGEQDAVGAPDLAVLLDEALGRDL